MILVAPQSSDTTPSSRQHWNSLSPAHSMADHALVPVLRDATVRFSCVAAQWAGAGRGGGDGARPLEPARGHGRVPRSRVTGSRRAARCGSAVAEALM